MGDGGDESGDSDDDDAPLLGPDPDPDSAGGSMVFTNDAFDANVDSDSDDGDDAARGYLVNARAPPQRVSLERPPAETGAGVDADAESDAELQLPRAAVQQPPAPELADGVEL